MSSLRRARVSADSPSARGSKPRPGLLARLTRLAARTRLTWWLWVSIVLAVAILVSMLVGMVEHAVDGIRFFARGVAADARYFMRDLALIYSESNRRERRDGGAS